MSYHSMWIEYADGADVYDMTWRSSTIAKREERLTHTMTTSITKKLRFRGTTEIVYEDEQVRALVYLPDSESAFRVPQNLDVTSLNRK